MLRRLVLAALLTASSAARAGDQAGPAAPRGRPTVVLEELGFPETVERAPVHKSRLRPTLAREARRLEWGAGRENRIVYRFYVTELAATVRGDVVTVRATAVGRLPKGRVAKSQITFSGSARERTETVNRVLEILARGVLTRLAELERIRRGQLSPSQVRKPAPI